MEVEKVREHKKPFTRFWYWIKERHKIYLKKQAAMPKPWTDDEILQNYFFTNPYRELDKTTQWLRRHVREPFADDPAIFVATVIFRWFNRISTGHLLRYGRPINHGCSGSPWKVKKEYCYLYTWNEKDVVTVLEKARKHGPVFTGAYMIKAGNGPKGCKIASVCKAISSVWEDREELVDLCLESSSLEKVWQRLLKFDYLGKFMAYEIVCDLRYTYLLRDAVDVLTWANPGPGAKRGLARMEGRIPISPTGRTRRFVKVDHPIEKMRGLLARVSGKLALLDMPPFELREIEHSLCEWDKYERALWGKGGKMKRRYDGSA